MNVGYCMVRMLDQLISVRIIWCIFSVTFYNSRVPFVVDILLWLFAVLYIMTIKDYNGCYFYVMLKSQLNGIQI